jgi:Holliday junction resolvase RusA-like endonuclease
MKSYPITPCPKPRMTRSDKWKQRPCVMRYRAFADEARLRDLKVNESGTHLRFDLPMPKSWGKAKRLSMEGQPHTQKPDIDNLVKAVFDALYTDDSHIWHFSAEKRWAVVGSISITERRT